MSYDTLRVVMMCLRHSYERLWRVDVDFRCAEIFIPLSVATRQLPLRGAYIKPLFVVAKRREGVYGKPLPVGSEAARGE